MRILLMLLSLFVSDQLVATALLDKVRSLVGLNLNGLMAIANEVDIDGRNALHHAARLGDLPLVEFLINIGVDALAEDKDGLLPLDHAINETEKSKSRQQMLIVSQILERTRGVHGVDEKGWLPLTWAIAGDDRQRVAELIDRMSGVVLNISRTGIIKVADLMQNDEIIKLLVTMVNDDGFTLLHRVAFYGLVEESRLLLKHGADPNAVANDGSTPLHRSANRGLVEESSLLLRYGANPNAIDKNGETPLHEVIKIGRAEAEQPEVEPVATVRLLLDNDADPNAVNKYGFTPAKMIVPGYNKEVFNLLRKHMIIPQKD